ncbi:MAG: hypothetical protein ABIW76_05195 [Fibrobacteria bacterium]
MEKAALRAQSQKGRTASAFLALATLSFLILAAPSPTGASEAAASATANRKAHFPVAVATIPSEYLPVSTMYRGATLYGTGKAVTVRFVHSTADWENQLYFVDPRTAKEIPLMVYHSIGRGNKCPDSGGLAADLGYRDSTEEIVFMLRTTASAFAGQYCTAEACGPRYTGLNDPLTSRFHSRGEFSHLANHMWAEAARITQAQADSLGPPCPGMPRGGSEPTGEGGVLFSFSDGANETFGDLVILVTGVEMDVERTGLPNPVVAGVPGDPLPVFCGIDADAGGVARGEAFQPQVMDVPVSAILPRSKPAQPRIYLDQSWRHLDPRRPDETHFPNGPEIRVTTPGAFEFNLGVFTNHGEFVNRAQGVVSGEMLRYIQVERDGRRTISLMWYPVSSKGNMASTGAYVVRGSFRTFPEAAPLEPSPFAARCPETSFKLLTTFGYIRN